MDGSPAGRDESSSSGVDQDGGLAIFFSQLRLLCTEVMDLLQNPKGRSSDSLVALTEFICRSSPIHLQSCFDYILLPLLLLLDGAVGCRAERRVDDEKKHSVPSSTPHVVSDNIAESLLLCLEELLKRCQLGSVDQMVMLLKKLATGCMLSASEASEEFRGGIVLCLKALLLHLNPCSIASCSCKLAPGLPFFSSKTSLGVQVDDLSSQPSECLILFLQSQDASAMVGHWLSLLLQIAETEASRGHHGSAKLRAEAYLTLRILIAKVGTADAMAFFLPGIVSRFGKALHISKTMISGAAGSADSLEHAIYGLVEFLMTTFGDEANLHGLGISSQDLMGSHLKRNRSSQSVLDALRQLPGTNESVNVLSTTDHNPESITGTLPPKAEFQVKSANGSLFVDRTKDWIYRTSEHVDKLLSATFPHLCINSATKVRLALVDAVHGLLTKCIFTLKRSKLMLLECLYVLVCDDATLVASAAQEYLEILTLDKNYLEEEDIADTFDRLICQLPAVVLGNEDVIAVLHAQRLLAAVYYAGPHRVVNHILHSQVTTARFLDSLSLSLSHNSVFAGLFGKFVLANPSPVGYLESLAELNNVLHLNTSPSTEIGDSVSSYITSLNPCSHSRVENVQSEHELPRAPPWFTNVGGQKLYKAVSGILRLIGLSLVTDYGSELSLSSVTDIPLEHIRKLVAELREKNYRKESWDSWYVRTGSGRLLREASTAVCVINEIIFGISDQSLALYINMFEKFGRKNAGDHFTFNEESAESAFGTEYMPANPVQYRPLSWTSSKRADAKDWAIDCIGTVLHEYLSQEIWNLPVAPSSLMQNVAAEKLTLHFFKDTSMLQQVIVDGLGICSISLGKDFKRSGFLQDCLYLLLENLICSNYQIKSTSDAVLHTFSASLGHKTVTDLVVENADYIIDSLCRYLRHLDLNPQVPNVLAAVLSYVGVAHDILPLLDEPMRSVSSELEVLGRHQHPELTVSFLKAMREIVKASRHEALLVSDKILQHNALVETKKEEMESQEKQTDSGMLLDNMNGCWEDMLFKLNELGTYRSTVGSVARSCFTAAGPLLASVKETTCLIALDIVEDGISALEMVERAYKHQKETKEEIKEMVQLLSLHDLQDILDASNGVDENILLPAMNKIWPYMVACFKQGNPVVVKRCLRTVSHVVEVCGGDFFIRRFQTDGSFLWKLLATGNTNRRRPSRVEGQLLLPYRKGQSAEESTAEVSVLKVQEAALNMITDIARNEKSASALGGIFRKVSSLVVGIACCGPDALQTAALNALSSLSLIDPDFIWVLLADIVYSFGKCVPSPPSSEFPEVTRILPPPSSTTEYLFMQYGGESHFELQLPKAEKVYRKLVSQVFTFQTMYI